MSKFLSYIAEVENWNSYRLEDGTQIRLRHIVTKVSKRDELGPNGKSIYDVEGQLIMDVTPSDFASDRPGKQSSSIGPLREPKELKP